MLKNIVVIADEDSRHDDAIRKGLSLASGCGASVEIIGFCHEDVEHFRNATGSKPNALKRSIIQHKAESIEAILNNLFDHEPAYKKIVIKSRVVWEAHIHDWITDNIRGNQYDLLVKTGRRSEKMFYTPTDWKLMRTCTMPVYLLTGKKWKKKPRILVAIDIQSRNKNKLMLNEKLLNTGSNIAASINAELNCCFVTHVPKVLKDLDLINISKYTKIIELEHMPRAIQLCEKYGIDRSNIYHMIGNPAGRILSMANRLKVDALVIGSIGRKGLTGKLVGNTAEQVLRHLYTDMIAVNLRAN